MLAKASNIILVVLLMMPFVARAAPGVLSQIPIADSASMPHNVIFLIDTSNGMLNPFPEAPFNPNKIYFSCPRSNRISASSPVDLVLKSGSPLIRINHKGSGVAWGTSGKGKCFANRRIYLASLNTAMEGPKGFGEYSGNYLNWYFGSAPTNWGSKASMKPGTRKFLDVQEAVMLELFDEIKNTRVGLAEVRNGAAARMLVPVNNIKSNRRQLKIELQKLEAKGQRPVGEALHRIGHYLVLGHEKSRLTMHPDSDNPIKKIAATPHGIFNRKILGTDGVKLVSPIQKWCQQTFVVLIASGGSGNDGNLKEDTGLTDYDGDCSDGEIRCGQDDTKPDGVYDQNGSDYLDDIAQAMFEMDLRPDLKDFSKNPVKNNATTYVVGFATSNQLLQDAAAQGGGLYFRADTAAQLKKSLLAVLADIIARVGSSSGVSFSASRLQADGSVFQAKYTAKLWIGNLSKRKLDEKGDVGAEEWSAASLLDKLSFKERFSFTYNNESKKAVRFKKLSDLSSLQQKDLNRGDAEDDGLGQERINYLLGDRSKEGTVFRKRASVLYDIINSSPLYVGEADSPWPDIAPFPATDAKKYSKFSEDLDRDPMIYVGTNGGNLQGYSAKNGRLRFEYKPSFLFSKNDNKGYHYLTDISYAHRYYLDGSPIAQDAYIRVTPGGGTNWHTVLIIGARAGGKGYAAFNVTNPRQFNDANLQKLLLWEFSSRDNKNLGFTFDKPMITLMNNGRWAAVFGNGYNNKGTGSAQIFIVYLDGGLDGKWELGKDYLVFNTFSGNKEEDDIEDGDGKNGISATTVVDLDENGTADRIYGTDIWGQIWVLDVSAKSSTGWKYAYGTIFKPQPLYRGDRTQPITAKVTVAKHPSQKDTSKNKPNVLVLVGTGQLLNMADKENTDKQVFLGIWDAGKGNLTMNDLMQQKMTGGDSRRRAMQNVMVDYGEKYGWYIELPTERERVLSNAIVVGENVFFTTNIPLAAKVQSCVVGGSGWLMGVRLENGGEPTIPIVDVNNDDKLDIMDRLQGRVTSGIYYEGGSPLQASIRDEYLFVPVNDGTLSKVKVHIGSDKEGRIAWHDLTLQGLPVDEEVEETSQTISEETVVEETVVEERADTALGSYIKALIRIIMGQ